MKKLYWVYKDSKEGFEELVVELENVFGDAIEIIDDTKLQCYEIKIKDDKLVSEILDRLAKASARFLNK